MKKIFIIILSLLLYPFLRVQAQNEIDVFDIMQDSLRVYKTVYGSPLQTDYDVNLYRDSANVLKTDDTLEVDALRIGDVEVISNLREIKNVTYPVGSKFREYHDSKIWIRDNIFEEWWTNGNAALAFNWTGFDHGTTQFRDAVFYDGKNNEIVTFDGSTHESIFNGNIVLGGNDISGDDFTFDDGTADAVTFNTATIGRLNMTSWISSTGDIDIRPAGGYNVTMNWQNTGGFYHYYNTTANFSVTGSAGNVYAGGYVDAAAFKVAGSAGTAGQVLISNGTTGAVWGTISTANDTANMATKATTQIMSGVKYWTSAQHFKSDILAEYVIRNPVSALDLRAGNGTAGQDIIVGYGTGYGDDFINYGGSTTAKFISYASGNAYIAGDLDIADDLDVDSIAGYKMWMDKATINDLTAGNVNATGSYKVNGSALNFSHLAGTAAISQIAATGTPSSTTYLRGDGTWATVSAGTSVDFANITTGLNSNTLTMGDGGILTYTSMGIVNANEWKGGGSLVSATEFGYLDGVTSSIQTQLNSKLSSEVDGSTTNEIQTLGTSGNTITLTSGGSVTAPYAATAPWSGISGKPTTLSGYGITDAASSSHTHTFASLTSKPTTLSGYGIADTYYGSVVGTNYWLSSEEEGLASTNLVAFPIYVGGTVHYLLAY